MKVRMYCLPIWEGMGVGPKDVTIDNLEGFGSEGRSEFRNFVSRHFSEDTGGACMLYQGNSGGASYKVAASHVVEALKIDMTNSFVP
jgi:hypothetical protein